MDWSIKSINLFEIDKVHIILAYYSHMIKSMLYQSIIASFDFHELI